MPLGQVIDEGEVWRDSDGLGDPLLADADSVRAPLLHQEAARAQRRRPAEPDQAAIALLLAEPEPADAVLASAEIWNPPADMPLPWDLTKQLAEAPTALEDQPAPEPPTQNLYLRRWGPRFLELVDLTASGLPISPIPTPVR